MDSNEKIKYDLISVADIDKKAPLELVSLGEYKKRHPNGQKYPDLPDDILGVVDNTIVPGETSSSNAVFHILFRNGYGIYLDKKH